MVITYKKGGNYILKKILVFFLLFVLIAGTIVSPVSASTDSSQDSETVNKSQTNSDPSWLVTSPDNVAAKAIDEPMMDIPAPYPPGGHSIYQTETVYISNAALGYTTAFSGTVSSLIKRELVKKVFIYGSLAGIVAAGINDLGYNNNGFKVKIYYKWQYARTSYYSLPTYQWVAYDATVGTY